MNFLPIAILAYFLNALALTADKFLLNKFIPDPLAYVFYFSAYSLLALLLVPFTHLPSTDVFLLSSLSTLLWTLGAYFMFKALISGQVSRVIPVIGTLTPLILFIQASISGAINLNQAWAVGFLILGLVFLTIVDWKGKIGLKELLFEVLASLFFAISYLLLKESYLRQDFLTVLVWSRMILLPVGLVMLITPAIRKRVLGSGGLKVNFKSKFGLLFMGGQFAGGLSQLMLTFSISLAQPALVNSLQGTQYIFLLIFSLILSAKFPKIFAEKAKANFLKVLGIIAVGFGLYILSFPSSQQNLKLGVSYSPYYAQSLGLNPKTTFVRLLDDLQVKTVRLPVYWNEVETFPNNFNFSSVDFYLSEAQKRNVKVILVLGYKQPRWPECFAPEWVSKDLRGEREQKILDLTKREVEHFKTFSAVSVWQVENEPLFYFGLCDKITPVTKDLLQREIEIVKNLDKRPILVTDSGELSSWISEISFGDIFGHTLYRQVWSPYFGFVGYPLPPFFYQFKGLIVKSLTQNLNKPVIVSELQAEPWIPLGKNALQLTPDEQAKLLPVSKIASNIEYAGQTGASEALLWGAEWWYYMAGNNHPEYIDYAKKIFKY